MLKKFKIQRELSQEEFEALLVRCEEECLLLSDKDILIRNLEATIEKIIPASHVYIVVVDPAQKFYTIPSLNRVTHFKQTQKGVMAECLKSKQSLIINLVEQSFLYSEQNDNLSNEEIKGVLVVPVLDESRSKEVLAMIWASTPQGTINQYTHRDIDYMNRFARLVKKSLFAQPSTTLPKTKEDEALEGDEVSEEMYVCQKAYETLQSKYHKEQEYFSATVHDIRTPMNGVLGFLELLETLEEDPQKKEYIESALSSGRDMVMLINDILDISKISSGNMMMESKPFSPLDKLSDSAKLFFVNAKKHGISLSVFLDPRLPEKITSDYHRIKQVINNLLSNAVKFTPKGGQIDLALRYDVSRDGLTVSVTDSGMGIAKDRQEAIFSPYMQEKDSTSREYGGTGLGLSISQQLAVLLGGKLELESQEGEGSRFHFTIPCQTTESTAPCVEIEETKGLRVLLYYAQKEHRGMKAAKAYLEAFGTHCRKGDGSSTLDTQSFDLLVISREDTPHNEEQIQEILDTDKPVLIVHESYLSEHNWFVGRVARVYMPLLPEELYNKILSIVRSRELEATLQRSKQELLMQKCSGKSALVVDDNHINLKLMKVMLDRLGLKVSLLEDGESALKQCQQEHFDIIFMDENMSGMNGTETIEKIRSLEQERSTLQPSVIFGYTGDAGSNVQEAFITSGANDVVIKPIALKKLEEIMIAYLP